MDESYSESDVSLSPSQILERLQVLRELQLRQRGKLQKQRLQFKETCETSTSMTEIVSHFSNSTSYNTFQSLLHSSNDILNELSPRLNKSNLSQNVQEHDLIEGVSVLNLSQESEFIISSPLSNRSKTSASSRKQESFRESQKQGVKNRSQNSTHKSLGTPLNGDNNVTLSKKQISLDDMPIISPKNNFEQLLLEKLKDEISIAEVKKPLEGVSIPNKNKKPFLRRGEGIARFGLKKNTIVIQNTKSLPWKRKSFQKPSTESPLKKSIMDLKNKNAKIQSKPELMISDLKKSSVNKKDTQCPLSYKSDDESHQQVKPFKKKDSSETIDTVPKNPIMAKESTAREHNLELLKATKKLEFDKNKYLLANSKEKTWAAVLTKEQSDFLKQLKQSEYYKNFNSPTKSVTSTISYDETMCNLRQERDNAEQNMFELLETKVSNDSFNLDNSFIRRFLRKSNIECSGESTPLVTQKCLSDNPYLMHLFPALTSEKRNEDSCSDVESCCSYTDCCSDACSSASCCSCKTVEQLNTPQNKEKDKNKKSTEQIRKHLKKSKKEIGHEQNSDITVTEDVMKENIAEMNNKLIATSELLKDRLRELEDEINTFRKENANLAKLREEVDQDKHKFYQEKAAFEQKLNEDKVLAEYYLAEEKDKLSKQKQIYDRYIREMRGRLNKKDKDEVVNLKKEINDLKEEIRIKDIKSTSTIARLRNQIKIMEKEKKELQDEVEKLKKENKRIKHNNEVTRRLTNIKYLEEINKKLTRMSSRDTKSEVNIDHDMKYKAYEIERQSRSKKVESHRGTFRSLPRAKSVPNLNVTSKYAKYFSQRDAISQIDQNKFLNVEKFISNPENDCLTNREDSASDKSLEDNPSSDNDDYIEKNYTDTFKSISPKSNRSSASYSDSDSKIIDKTHLKANDFFIHKANSNSARNSRSPATLSPSFSTDNLIRNWNKSPISILSNKCSNPSSNSTAHVSSHSSSNNFHKRSQSPLSAFNSSSLQPVTVINTKEYGDKLMSVSPEPVVSKTSLTKTNLNPTEFRKPDGSRELRFPNGNVKHISADGKYSKFVYYNGDVKENFYDEGRIKYYYAETKTYHTTHADGLEVLEFPDGQVEKRYKDGSSEIRLPNGSVRYFDPKNKHIREEWRFPDGAALTVAANGERRIVFSNGQVEVHAQDHKRREFPDGTVKLVYNDGTSETRYASGRVRIKDKHGNLIMDSAPS